MHPVLSVPDSVIQGRSLGRLLDNHHEQPVVREALPTRYLPGDPRKVDDMVKRVQLRLPLHHAHDAKLPERWVWGDNKRGDNGRDVERTLYDAQGQVVLVKRLQGNQWHLTFLNEYGDFRNSSP